MATDWKDLFVEANALLRTSLAIARRQGKTTNWEAHEKQLEKALDDQHELVNAIRRDDGS